MHAAVAVLLLCCFLLWTAHPPRPLLCTCPTPRPPPQKKLSAREDAAAARERGAAQLASELEERVAAFDAKEKKALRVGVGPGWVGEVAAVI